MTTTNQKQKQKLISALKERVAGYESSDKTELIYELLNYIDVYSLTAICSQQGIKIDVKEEHNPLFAAHKDSNSNLYSWNWIGGGYHQLYADTEQEAIDHANGFGDKKPDMSSFKVHSNTTS